jgi:hypothetical protein
MNGLIEWLRRQWNHNRCGFALSVQQRRKHDLTQRWWLHRRDVNAIARLIEDARVDAARGRVLSASIEAVVREPALSIPEQAAILQRLMMAERSRPS